MSDDTSCRGWWRTSLGGPWQCSPVCATEAEAERFLRQLTGALDVQVLPADVTPDNADAWRQRVKQCRRRGQRHRRG